MRFILLYIGLILITLCSCSEKKTGYVELSQLYSEFDMTKELNKNLEKATLIKTQILDSLKFNIKQIEIQLNTEAIDTLIQRYELKKQEYLYTQQKFNEENQRISQQYYEQSLNQINTYVKDYGKENNYEYIFGATGSGSMMYADSNNNLTNELISFINEKYQGK